MEEGTKQQQLLFDKGITNVPSDALCSDNALEECIGMVYRHGEHQVIQKPKAEMSVQGSLIFVHKPSSGQDVYVEERNGMIYFGESGIIFAITGKYTIEAVGNTIIIADEAGMHYFIWRATENGYIYKHYDNLPEVNFEPWLWSGNGIQEDPEESSPYKVKSVHSEKDVLAENNGKLHFADVENNKSLNEYNTILAGLYAENKKRVAEEKGFCLPFFVRTALRLYDGSYAHITQPILMLPSLTRSTFLRFDCEYDKFYLLTKYAHMYFNQSVDLSEWEDIIKDVDIFVTKGVEIYDLEGNWQIGEQLTPPSSQTFQNLGPVFDGIYKDTYSNDESRLVIEEYMMQSEREKFHPDEGVEGFPRLFAILAMKQRLSTDIDNDIKNDSVFFKLGSIGLKPIINGGIGHYTETSTMKTLTTQKQLEYDDYYSHTTLYPGITFPYNSRLNISAVKRSIFEGYKFFMPFSDTGSTTHYDVSILTDSGTKMASTDGIGGHHPWYYFFYPDPRAKRVMITRTKNGVVTTRIYSLKEHEGLNAAYYFAGVRNILNQVISDGLEETWPAYADSTPEYLGNYVITSEVNNPFVFLAEGYNAVGTGEIIGVSTTTMALSQDAFGRTDMMVFSKNGIWGMQVDGKGTFQSIHPFSREVCNNPASITPTDGAVFFTSEKGLMIATDAGVKCVSEQMSGRESLFSGEATMGGSFIDFLRTCFIAYDYRDSLLWIFNAGHRFCYIYSMLGQSFSKYDFGSAPITSVVNNYPDYLLQAGDTVYSLQHRTDVNDDTEGGVKNSYQATLITRPLKLEDGLALKTITQVRHIKHIDGSLGMRLYASNNLNSWVELHSLRGIPWKYYRIRLDFHNLHATDRFAGTIFVTQERRSDKLR